MKAITQLSQHFRAFFYGGNWTSVDFKNTIENVDWQQATTQVYSFNTIATLVFHIHYYVGALLKVLEGGPLNAKDEFSFSHPPIHCQQDWEQLLQQVWTDVEKFVELLQQLPEERLWQNLEGGNYGNYYRNFSGIIEHSHYHLGQIVLIKKILLHTQNNEATI